MPALDEHMLIPLVAYASPAAAPLPVPLQSSGRWPEQQPPDCAALPHLEVAAPAAQAAQEDKGQPAL